MKRGFSMQTPDTITPLLTALRTFQGVPAHDVHALVAAGTVVELASGETLVEAGAPSGTGWLLAKGRLRLEVATPARALGDVWPGELVGAHGLFGPSKEHVVTIIASHDSILVAMDRASCQTARLRVNRAMAALQRHMLIVTARRLSSIDSSRSQAQVGNHHPQPTHLLPPDRTTLLGWLRSIFGGAG